MRPRLSSLLALLFLALGGNLLAQSVRWDPPGGQLGFNQTSELALVFEDCEPETDQFRLPQVNGLTFGRPSQSSQTSIINFKRSTTFSLVFPIRPSTRSALTIPAFDVKTDKGTLRVPAATFTVGDATVGQSGLALADVASARLDLPKTTFWAGEVIPVSYTLNIVRRYYHSLASNIAWPATPFVAEEWSKPEPAESLIRGERRVVSTQTTRAYIKQPGAYTLNPASQVVNLMVGTTGFGLFSSPAVEQRQIDTDPVNVTIRALPAAPPDFSGAVGKFELRSKIVPANAAVGEPVTWTLELAGVGNWPDIAGLPQREVSADFQVVQPNSKRTMKDNALFEGTLGEDVVLVPTKPGNYTLGPVRFTYFDPAAGAYKTITTEKVTVAVTAASAAPAVAGPGAPRQFSLNLPAEASGPATPALPAAVPPVPPENLPGRTLPDSARGWAPLAHQPLLALFTAAATVLPLLAWLTLAALRSRVTDPARRRREARAALAATLAELPGASAATLPALLGRWQAHAAALWEIPHAAPGAPLVQATVASRSASAATTWTALWQEADRAIHGPAAALPTDWRTRAEAALQAVKVPGWNPLSLFAGRNLLPLLATLLALGLAAPASLRAADGAESYARGDFRAAETAWRAAVAQAPRDWHARHNLGLALAQQDRWAEATAHWTSAFLLAPRAPETRADLALGLQRSGLAPAELVAFSRGEGRHALARLASPAEWQALLVLAALLIGGGFILIALQAYRRIGAWGRPTALTALLLAVLLAGAATLSLHTYGPLAQPNAVLVWQPGTLRSVPTEADTQKTTALSAGSIAVADRTFLAGQWTALTFPGGQTGWARTQELLPLYP